MTPAARAGDRDPGAGVDAEGGGVDAKAAGVDVGDPGEGVGAGGPGVPAGEEEQPASTSTTATHRRPYAIFMRRTVRPSGSLYEAIGLAPRTSGAPSLAASAVASSGIFCDCRSASTRAR